MKKLLILAITLMLAGCSNGTSAKKYYQEGITALDEGHYEAAEQALYNAIDKSKEKAEYYIAYGMALTKMGKYEQAQKQFDKSILDKNNKIVRENNKQAYRGKGIAYLEAGEYADAIENFETALEIDEKDDLNIDIMFYLAEANEKSGDYEKAVLVYNSIEKIEKSSVLYVKRAKANMELAQYAVSEKDFDSAISMDKNKFSYYLEKYFMLVKANREEASEWIATVSIAGAKDEKNKIYAAVLQYYQGEKEKAMSSLSELEQNNILASYYLADIYVEENEMEKAAECYEKCVKDKEKQTEFSEEVYGKLAQCYIQMEEYEKAVVLLEEAIASEQGNSQKKLQKTMVAVYEKNLQFDKALQTAKSYLEVYPKDKEMKREYKFLRSRVETITDSQDSQQEQNDQSAGTKEPEATTVPDASSGIGKTENPVQTLAPETTDLNEDNGNVGKPDIIE